MKGNIEIIMNHKNVYSTDASKKINKTYTPYLKVCIPDLRTINQLMFEYLNKYNKYRFIELQGGYVFSLGWKW